MPWKAQVQTVRLLEPEGTWWAHNSGSVLLAVAAIFAASLAAYVASRNVRKQLAHDRLLRTQDRREDTIEAAVTSANEAVIDINSFASDVMTTEIWRGTAEEVLADQSSSADEKAAAVSASKKWRGELEAKRDACYPKLNAMRAANIRLELRLGDEHPIVATQDATREALFALFAESAGGVAVSREQFSRDGDDARVDDVGNAFTAFRDACYAWLNE